ncbi:hypothetical protein D6D19_01682 [Aureobasidium pullulans]|uniref:Uncharacterized protein n=1 Tax=Aureobasidium pullulans TaxID=5580 RepID=A0A4S8SHR0_AURPU|nr:hypothetical protein D6D28_05444 [Aureobasidium pullulans]THW78762.1 hypothetical protein D6D19_01682 [Aureobasidium pullulans]THY30865.1 hypothetical protein D6D00_02700 [Aureobasidium pullulans]THY94354.1 hypothetical protein D6C92_04916 [Aureobasidium pullulans]
MSSAGHTNDSPDNGHSTNGFKMRTPSLKFMYHLECEMSQENHVVGAQFGTSNARVIMPIVGGTVKGPRISAIIQNMSGADWGLAIGGTGLMRLDARYTLKTDDGHCIYVRSKGIFKPGPGVDINPATRTRMTQDEVEWFTRLQFEASGPYDWMNSVFGIGVLAMDESKILIDAYELTNFM